MFDLSINIRSDRRRQLVWTRLSGLPLSYCKSVGYIAAQTTQHFLTGFSVVCQHHSCVEQGSAE
jgi:hypothetical protein